MQGQRIDGIFQLIPINFWFLSYFKIITIFIASDSKYYLGIDRKNFNRTRNFVENLIEYLYNNTHNHNYEVQNQTVPNCAKYFEEKKVDNVEEQFEKYKKLVYENIMFELFVRLTGQVRQNFNPKSENFVVRIF